MTIDATQAAGPASPMDLVMAGLAQHQAGALADAERAYRAALDLDPHCADAWHLLGMLSAGAGNADLAAKLITHAVELVPGFADAWLNLGNVFKSLERLDEAEGAYRQALALRPDWALAHNNLGNLLRTRGARDGAIAAYRAAIEADPDYAEAHYNLGVSHLDVGDYAVAEAQSRRALEIAPAFAAAQVSLSSALTGLKRHKEATAALKEAYRLDPKNIDILRIFAGHFEGRREYEKAAGCYLEMLALQPEDGATFARLVDIVLTLCDWRNYEGFKDSLLTTVRNQIAAGKPFSSDVFNLLAFPVDNALILEASRARAHQFAKDARTAPLGLSHARPKADAKIRLGYLLPYTEKHSMPLVLRDIVAGHDRGRFEVFGYAMRRCDGSSFSKSFRASFDSFRDLPRTSSEADARLVHRDGIEVLIDTTAHTGANCMPILAHRPAPVQAHYLGYSLTTGSDYTDYLITDRNFIPPEWARFCSENLVYLPDSFMATTRAPIATRTVKRSTYRLPEDAVVLCNFNHPCKLEPRIFDAWMRILAAVPDAVMWFGTWSRDTHKNLWREARARGVDPRRLRFARIVRHPNHLKRLGLADLALDNLWHGGGVTTVDALWAGLPVLTIEGGTPAARLGTTLSRAANFPDLIVPDMEAYVETAIALGRDRDRLAALKAKLAATAPTSPLFDTPRYIRHLDTAYAEMWRLWAAGEPPRKIEVAPAR
jgi:predicted O-linked N-acetylglucosamine transferase (SPINDLY family)